MCPAFKLSEVSLITLVERGSVVQIVDASAIRSIVSEGKLFGVR